jgi:hypothetical protein
MKGHMEAGGKALSDGEPMVNEGGSFAQRTFSFVMRLLVSLVLPAWGLTMILLGARSAAGWWIATGVVVLAIGAIFFAGSSLITPFLPGGRRFG